MVGRKKGYIYTLEAGIAVSIVLIAMVLILSSQRSAPPLSAAFVKQQGIGALEYLDQKGELRPLAVLGDISTIKDRMVTLLPAGVSTAVVICETECYTSPPVNKPVISVDYYISVYKDSFIKKKIRLWMWGDFS